MYILFIKWMAKNFNSHTCTAFRFSLSAPFYQMKITRQMGVSEESHVFAMLKCLAPFMLLCEIDPDEMLLKQIEELIFPCVV